MESFELGKNSTSEGFGGLGVKIGDALGIGADVLEQTSDTTEGLVEVMAFLEWMRDGLT